MINITMKCDGEVKGNVTFICPYAWNCLRYKIYIAGENATELKVAYSLEKRVCPNYKPFDNHTCQ